MESLELKRCECGCGQIAKPGNRFIYGHNARVNNPNPKIPIEIRTCVCGCGETFECRIDFDQRFISGHNTRINNPMKNPEISIKMSGERNRQIQLNYNKDHPEKGEKHSKWMKQYCSSLKNREEARRKSKRFHKDNPEVVKRQYELLPTEEKNKRAKRLSQTSAFPKQSETELFVLETLEYYFQGWDYSGDGSYILEGKIPDFINHEKKLIIEVFEDYWHKEDDGEDRKALFAKAGYRTLILWEEDIKRNGRTWTKEKIEEFIAEK